MKELTISPSITPRESENLSRYFSDISSTHPLDAEQEATLAERIQRGDLKARNELVTANLRFVVSVAKQYQNMGADLEDLINEGNLGLIRASETFDPTKGFKFTTFAVWWIRQAILNFIAETGQMVRLPQNVTNTLHQLRNAESMFEQANHRKPSEEELAQIMNMSVERVEDILSYTTITTSLDAPLTYESESTIGDVVPDTNTTDTDHQLMDESLRHDLDVALRALSQRDQQVIRAYFGLDGEALSVDSIAMEQHLSRERVRQIIDKGLHDMEKLHGKALKQHGR